MFLEQELRDIFLDASKDMPWFKQFQSSFKEAETHVLSLHRLQS